MSNSRDLTAGVIVMVIVKDGEVISAPAVVSAERTDLMRSDGTVDGLVNMIAARRIAEAQSKIRRPRNR